MMMGSRQEHLRSVSVSYPVRPMSFDSESLYDDACGQARNESPEPSDVEQPSAVPPEAPWPPPAVKHFQPNLEFFKLFSVYIPSEEKLIDGNVSLASPPIVE
jgi:hypothetical protein